MPKLFIHDRRRRFVAAALAVWTLMLMGLWAQANAQTLPAAGDQGHLWFVEPASDGKSLTLFHRGPGDPANALTVVETLHGQLRRSGIAAWGNHVWLMYVDGTVQRITARQADTQTGWSFSSQPERALPPTSKATLRATAGSPLGPWVLIQARDPAVLAQVERSLASTPSRESSVTAAQARRNIALGLPPDLPLPGFTQENTQTPPTQESTAVQESTARDPSQPISRDERVPVAESATPRTIAGASPSLSPSHSPNQPRRSTSQGSTATQQSTVAPKPNVNPHKRLDHLLHLDAGRWAPIPLPDDWPHNAPATLTLMGDDGNRPVLLVQPPDTPAGTLWVYRRGRNETSQTWVRQTTQLKGVGPLAAMVIEGQLVVCRGLLNASPTQVDVAVVRPEKVIPVGTMSVATSRAEPWTALPMDRTAALVVRTESASSNSATSGQRQAPPKSSKQATAASSQGLHLTWVRMDLSGKVVEPATPLTLREISPWADAAEYVVMLGVGVVALLLMLLFWQRDPQSNQLTLPDDVTLADFGRRSIAGIIDLAPPVAFVMWFYGLGLGTLLEKHWPGAAGTFQAIIPGSLAILIFTVHTTVTECLTTRTLGKSVTGLRVIAMDGKRPRLWQLALRGVLKIIDLIAWLLLVLMFIGPFRQRLGDLIARTVVVMKTPEDEVDDDDEDGQ